MPVAARTTVNAQIKMLAFVFGCPEIIAISMGGKLMVLRTNHPCQALCLDFWRRVMGEHQECRSGAGCWMLGAGCWVLDAGVQGFRVLQRTPTRINSALTLCERCLDET